MKKYLLLGLLVGCVTLIASSSTAQADHFYRGGSCGGYGRGGYYGGYRGYGHSHGGYGYGRPSYYSRPYYGGYYGGGYGYGGYPAYGSGIGIVIQRPGFSLGFGGYGW